MAITGLAGKILAEVTAGNAARLEQFAKLRHRPFSGGKLLRMPTLVLGMAYYRLQNYL